MTFWNFPRNENSDILLREGQSDISLWNTESVSAASWVISNQLPGRKPEDLGVLCTVIFLGWRGANSLEVWGLQQSVWRAAMRTDGQAGEKPGKFFWVLLGFSNNQHVLTKHFDFDKLVFF